MEIKLKGSRITSPYFIRLLLSIEEKPRKSLFCSSSIGSIGVDLDVGVLTLASLIS